MSNDIFIFSNNIISDIILLILGISSLITVFEATGLLSEKWTLKLNKNKIITFSEALRYLGYKPVRKLDQINTYQSGVYKECLDEIVRKARVGGTVTFGNQITVTDQYIDIRGLSSDPEVAELCAKILYSHINSNLDLKNIIMDVDVLVGPKLGSPFIIYELGKLLNKSIFISLDNPKYISPENFSKSLIRKLLFDIMLLRAVL